MTKTDARTSRGRGPVSSIIVILKLLLGTVTNLVFEVVA